MGKWRALIMYIEQAAYSVFTVQVKCNGPIPTTSESGDSDSHWVLFRWDGAVDVWVYFSLRPLLSIVPAEMSSH